jgi:hypothetical protein
MAERAGFEPAVTRGYTRSPGVPVKPLQHLSVLIQGQLYIKLIFTLLANFAAASGGEGGIRTHAQLAPRPLFESGTMNHSDTSPSFKFYLKSSIERKKIFQAVCYVN